MNRRCKCLRWAFHLPDWEPSRAEWLQVIQSMQEDEITRVNRFVFRDDSKSAAVGRLMIRASLAHLLNVPWTQMRFGRNEKGKPFLLNADGQEHSQSFNISHDADYVVLATDCGPACGVDVMKVHFRPTSSEKTVTEYLNLMKRQFSASEWRSMERAQLDRQKLALFYRFWCLKESYVKAIGTGIHSDLVSIDFRYDNDDPSTHAPRLWLHGKPSSDWRFFEYNLDDQYVAAVCTTAASQDYCTRRGEGNMPFETVTINDLLSKAQPLREANEEWYDNFCAKPRKGVAK